MAKYRPNNDKRYSENHRLHRRYLSYRSTARTFVRKYAQPTDINQLWKIWNARKQITIDKSTNLTNYEKILIKKLRIDTKKYTKFMEEMANHKFSFKNFKICLDIMGQIEAFGNALINYDQSQVKFVNKLIDKVNQMELKAGKIAKRY